ncbi:MAG: VPLPA-CTERM sorting domain-containing protein [Gammaproteobacteria bacterium]|nr:VPLPA-CTERM sorting domain-containing protein [Gammaproteobacteria bacterium]
MIKKVIAALTVGLLLAVNANAASMSIVGPDKVRVGDTFELQIWGDFSGEGLIAGGINLFWDPALVQLNSINLKLNTVADFSCPGSVNCPPNTANSAVIVWGQFLTDLIAPTDVPPTLMANLSFTATAPGLAVFDMVTNGALTGGWFGAGFTPIDDPTFGLHTMGINIPLPAAVWFMIAGLASLAGFRRK